MKLKNIAYVFVQVAIILILIFMFFYTAPLLNCKSLDDFPSSKFERVEIPAYAKCFYINHGEVRFKSQLPISEDITPFAILLLAFMALFGLLLFINYKQRHQDKVDTRN